MLPLREALRCGQWDDVPPAFRIPADHPSRTIQALVNPILTALSPRFQTMYSDLTVFTKNRDRLLEGSIADAFLQEVKAADARGLLSHEHFTVDGTLLAYRS